MQCQNNFYSALNLNINMNEQIVNYILILIILEDELNGIENLNQHLTNFDVNLRRKGEELLFLDHEYKIKQIYYVH